jgi:hypothetical protein
MECNIRRKEEAKIRNKVIKTFRRKEKITLAIKKYESKLTINETVRAEDERAIVLIEETIKIFSERRSE